MAEKWITNRMPDNEDTVEVRTRHGVKLAWWKGVGWKCGPGQWIEERVIGWREID